MKRTLSAMAVAVVVAVVGLYAESTVAILDFGAPVVPACNHILVYADFDLVGEGFFTRAQLEAWWSGDGYLIPKAALGMAIEQEYDTTYEETACEG